MITFIECGIFLLSVGILAYQRAALSVWTFSIFWLLLFLSVFGNLSVIALSMWWLVGGIPLTFLNMAPLRRRFLSQPILAWYRRSMPTMSRTERESLNAGTVGWEGDLFKGSPRWQKLLKYPIPSLSEEERCFLDGPVNTLCMMLDDWRITNDQFDLPKSVWEFLKREGFFGLIIPKKYGGKAFSAYAHSIILAKIAGHSITAYTTVSVPNSLGPAELLLQYGTPQQKEYYLPKLSRGEEIPCFALTSPFAGSDANAMQDTGTVVWGEWEGKRTLGISLNFNKRYITLAPVATVIGLAFKLYDPNHLLGHRDEIGITCALIARNTPGITIGRRHFPLNVPFQNGPIQGKDVFIPLDWIIGGPPQAGCGWRMLMECLAAGRAISIPACGMGGAQVAAFSTGAYARVRQQFHMPIGHFEGVQEVLARIAGHTYIINAACTFTAGQIDLQEKPAVASAILKYHVTELARHIANDAMDIHGGKGICLGPRNYIGRGYQAIPIGITVEGANILTRNMIIFGQGVMRCHPYVYTEFEAARKKQDTAALFVFDRALMGHVGFFISNVVRTGWLAWSRGRLVSAPRGPFKSIFQKLSRYSSAFALLTDAALMSMGGSLKRKENISARLADILSDLYLLSTVLKKHQDASHPEQEIPLVSWCCQMLLFRLENTFLTLLQNFPGRLFAALLKWLIFPWGRSEKYPNDRLTHQVAALILSPTDTRARLCETVWLSDTEDPLSKLSQALHLNILAEPIEKIIRSAKHKNMIQARTLLEGASEAHAQGLLSPEQWETIKVSEKARADVLAVDDFCIQESHFCYTCGPIARTTSQP